MANLGLTDRPVVSLSEESLGVKDYMEALSEFVVTCETPMTIAIQADWGAGKTSMMNLVKAKLEDENIETIWFNTWQFSQFNMGDDLPISLLGQFAKKFNTAGSEVKSKVLATVKALGRIGSKQMGLEDAYDAMYATDTDSAQIIIELKEELNKAVAAKIKNSTGDRVVIFIDDLDRLVPEKAVELLETMKLFLDIHGCVFVLAIDYNVVIKGLEKKFGTSVDDMKGKSFFDKIIQLPFNLPVAQYDVSKYFKKLLHGKFDYNEADIEIFVKLANNSVGFNPRSMKRLFNSLQLLKMVAKSKKILDGDSVATAQEKQRILFAILCLQTAYESMYRLMLKHKSKIDQEFFDTFSDLETLKESEFYEEVKKELNIKEDEDDKVIRFIEFLNTFYESIQLDTDGNNDNLSEKELENFMRFLSFSSITTSNTQGIDASNGIFQFKSIAIPFINDVLKPKFKDSLSDMHSDIEITSNNNQGIIYFTFTQGSMDFNLLSWRDSKKITIWLNHRSGNKNTVKRWFRENMLDIYPDMKNGNGHKYGYFVLEVYEFTEDEISQSEDVKMEIYKDLTLKAYEKIIPRLSKHYVETEPIVKSVQGFIKKLELELKKEFTIEDGWQVDMGKNMRLGYDEPIYLYNENWKDKTFAISITPASSFFRKLYFGVRKYSRKTTFDKVLSREILETFQNEFGGGDTDDLWVWTKIFDQYSNTISGEPYYEKTAEYNYSNTENEDEAIKYFLTQLVTLKSYKDQLTDLADTRN